MILIVSSPTSLDDPGWTYDNKIGQSWSCQQALMFLVVSMPMSLEDARRAYANELGRSRVCSLTVLAVSLILREKTRTISILLKLTLNCCDLGADNLAHVNDVCKWPYQ